MPPSHTIEHPNNVISFLDREVGSPAHILVQLLQSPELWWHSCGGIFVVVQSWGDGGDGGRKATTGSAEETFDERLYVTRTASQLYIFVSRSSGKEPGSFRSVQLISVCPIVPSDLCPPVCS
jgi:hypothetical protein